MHLTLSFLKYLLPFSLLLYLIQYFVVSALFPETYFFYPLWSVYLFMVIATYTGYTFMGLGVIKMLAAVIFLIPLIRSDTENRIPDVAMFFIAYFLFLGFETYKAIQLLKR